MKKLLLGLLLVIALLGALPASATPVNDLAALASYFPDSTYIYLGFRTDSVYLGQIDRVVARIASAIPGGASASLAAGLDSIVTQMTGSGTFRADVRPWLGSNGAVAVLNTPPTAQSGSYVSPTAPVIALGITDRAGAEAFMNDVFTYRFSSDFEKSTSADHTLFIPNGSNADYYAMVTANALFITSNKTLLPLQNRPASPLSGKEQFTSSVGWLPETDYNALVYIDLPQILSQFYTGYAASGATTSGMSNLMVQQILNAYGPATIGLTVLNDRALTADMAIKFDYQAIVSAMGLEMSPITPFDANSQIFNYVPDSARLVAHGTALGPLIQSELHNLRNMSDIMQSMGVTQSPNGANNPFGNVNPRDIANFITLAFSGMTGLSLQNDVLNWMTGDYVLFASENPDAANPAGRAFPADLGLVIQVTDPAAAGKVFTGVQSALDQFEAQYATETVGGASVITIPLNHQGAPSEMAIGYNEHVMAVGTRHAVESVFDSSDKLASDTVFTDEQSRMLDGAYLSFYTNVSGLEPLLTALQRFDNPASSSVVDSTTTAILGLFDSAAVSAALDQQNGLLTMRFVLTMSPSS